MIKVDTKKWVAQDISERNPEGRKKVEMPKLINLEQPSSTGVPRKVARGSARDREKKHIYK
jgi:hypothetical protein